MNKCFKCLIEMILLKNIYEIIIDICKLICLFDCYFVVLMISTTSLKTFNFV